MNNNNVMSSAQGPKKFDLVHWVKRSLCMDGQTSYPQPYKKKLSWLLILMYVEEAVGGRSPPKRHIITPKEQRDLSITMRNAFSPPHSINDVRPASLSWTSLSSEKWISFPVLIKTEETQTPESRASIIWQLTQILSPKPWRTSCLTFMIQSLCPSYRRSKLDSTIMSFVIWVIR